MEREHHYILYLEAQNYDGKFILNELGWKTRIWSSQRLCMGYAKHMPFINRRKIQTCFIVKYLHLQGNYCKQTENITLASLRKFTV